MLPAIDDFSLTEAASLELVFLSKFLLHLHRIQPNRFQDRVLHGESVDSTEKCEKSKISNLST